MKKNRIKDSMLQKFRDKDIQGLKELGSQYPKYALKTDCYIQRILRKVKK